MGNEYGQPFFDRVQLLDNIDNDTGVLKNLCKVFLDTLQPMLDDVRAAVLSKDPAKLASTAHKLKGSFANFYAGRAREAALALERMGKDARFEEVGVALAALENEVLSLTSVLEKELRGDDGTNEQEVKEAPHLSPALVAGTPEETREKTVSNFERMLKDLNNDRKLFRELGTSFLKTSEQHLEAIRNVAHSKNSAALLDAANTFKGMVSGYYAERLMVAVEMLADLGRRENFNTVDAAIEKLGLEANLFCDELQGAISCETAEAQDNTTNKKADVLDIIDELRLSIETTDALKTAIQHRIDDLESHITAKDEELAKLREEFESFRDAMRSGETQQSNSSPVASSSGQMIEMTKEMTEKIVAIEREFFGEKAELELTRKDIRGIIGMLKDFRKMFYMLIVRFGSHMTQHHQKKVPSVNQHDKDWPLKKYKYKGI